MKPMHEMLIPAFVSEADVSASDLASSELCTDLDSLSVQGSHRTAAAEERLT